MGVPLCTCNEQVNATAQISIEEITNKDNIVQKHQLEIYLIPLKFLK